MGITFNVIAPDGTRCGALGYAENVSDTLSVSAGNESATWETPLDNGEFMLDCPSHRYTSSPDDSLTCEGVDGADVPHFEYSRSGPPYSFTVISRGAPLPLFTCQ